MEKLRRYCRPDELRYDTSEEVTPLKDFIGQERAVRAMQFGLAMRAPGYNIYVAGPPGTGKSTYVQEILRQVSLSAKAPDDWVYLYNFSNPDNPVAISLSRGTGAIFQRDMEAMIRDFRTAIPKSFEGADYEQNRAAIIQEAEQEIESALAGLRQEAAEEGFVLKQTSAGFLFIPVNNGKRYTQDEFDALPQDEQREIERRGRVLQQRLEEVMSSGRQTERRSREKIQELDRQMVLSAAGRPIQNLQDKYKDYSQLVEYLDNLLEDIALNIDLIKPGDGSSVAGMSGGQGLFDRYKVNLFVNNADKKGAPVVFETSPNYYNLFGKIEYRSQMGTVSTDFTMVKAGAIHRANGGYLVLQVKDLLSDPGVWETLKRALKNKMAVVENIGEQFRMVPTVSLRPEPISLNLKVVLVGSHQIYHLLHSIDEDFQKFFKVKVDFDTEMPRTEENLSHYAAFVGAVCRREKLPHFDRSGLAELIEHGSRLAGNQEKLSTRFNEVIEIVYEAAAWAEGEGAVMVSAPHVKKAIEERIYRSNRIEEKIQEMLLKGTIMVDTDGYVIGQVNGLSVLDMGDYAFGKPSRITARTFMGHEGLVNIERETKMSGSSHSKGVLTLVGYLGGMFARDKPLRLSARLSFEQLYEGVDGDSASSAELYALLSSLSGIPINQGIAVTGSVNQRGEIQPVGGVTEKIEGFFHLCKARGLNGRQGVIIPARNVADLMLQHEVVQAVAEKKFSIYAITAVEEGIEILTGVPAGTLDENNNYIEDTVFYKVDQKLREYARGLTGYAAGADITPGGGCAGDCCS